MIAGIEGWVHAPTNLIWHDPAASGCHVRASCDGHRLLCHQSARLVQPSASCDTPSLQLSLLSPHRARHRLDDVTKVEYSSAIRHRPYPQHLFVSTSVRLTQKGDSPS
jgi:hypothetical protein